MSLLSFLPSTAVLGLAYLAYLAVYRIYLSPVSHIPGPILAKLTFWYVPLKQKQDHEEPREIQGTNLSLTAYDMI